jgi:hypothetical protein
MSENLEEKLELYVSGYSHVMKQMTFDEYVKLTTDVRIEQFKAECKELVELAKKVDWFSTNPCL